MENYNSSDLKNILIFQGDNNLNNILEKLTFKFYSSVILIRFVLTIFLRIGFLFVHIGTVPVTNVNLILLQNLIDFTCTTFTYFLVRFIISYSIDNNNSLIGGTHWIGETNINITEVLIGWQTISITAAISISGVIGRLHTIGCLISSILFSGVLQPFLIYWAWISNSWMNKNNLLEKKVVFQDHSGAAIIHVAGGLSALIGCLILGRRILRLKDIDKSSVPSSSPAIVFAGYFLIFLGLQANSLNKVSDKWDQVLMNNLWATSSSSLIVIILHFLVRKRFSGLWKSTTCMQSIISGLVAVSGASNIYSPIVSMAFGFITGFIFYGFSEIIFRSALEDNCNIIATHLISGFLGSILTPLGIYNSEEGKSIGIDILWQAICLISIMSAVIVIMVPVYLQLKIFKCLRNRSEFLNHFRATEALKTEPRKFSMQRIFSLEKGKTIFLKSGSVSNLLTKNFTDSFFELISNRNSLKTKKEGDEPMEKSEMVADLKINEEAKEDNFEEILCFKETRMKKHRNVYTIQSLIDQMEIRGSVEEINLRKNVSSSESESTKKSHKFQDFGAGDSFFNQCFSNKEGNKNKDDIKNQENEKDSDEIKGEIINAKDSSYEIRKTSKLTNLANPLSSKSSIDFLFGPKKNFRSSESLVETSECLRQKLSTINLDLISKYSSQSIPVRKSF